MSYSFASSMTMCFLTLLLLFGPCDSSGFVEEETVSAEDRVVERGGER